MKLTISILVALFTAPLFANPAISYSCHGISKVNNEAYSEVVFKVIYANWTDQLRFDYENAVFTTPENVQMNLPELRTAADNNDCVDFKELTTEGSEKFTYYRFEYNVSCEGEDKTELLAFCTKEN